MNLLLAAVLLAQDQTAEETLKKIEKVLLTSKSASLKFVATEDVKSGGTEGRLISTGALLLKEGNRVHLEQTTVFRTSTLTHLWITDGQRIYSKYDPEPQVRNLKNSDGINNKVISAFVRLGVSTAEAILRDAFLGNPKGEEVDFGKSVALSEFAAGPDEGASKTLTYRVNLKVGATSNGTIKLWYEPVTYKMIKRSWTMKREGFDSSCAETYTDFNLNADIPDEKFKLPEGKK